MAKEIDSYWSGDGEAYIIGEWAFVLTPDLRTVRIPKANLEKRSNEKISPTMPPERTTIKIWRAKPRNRVKHRRRWVK